MNSKGGILEELGLVKKKHIKINSNVMLADFFLSALETLNICNFYLVELDVLI